MKGINQDNLILEKDVFTRTEIEKRMTEGGFNSLAKFELFIWDLEMFLQLQKKLGEKILLKGGAATQFYIPIEAQRTSIDIDMICLATREEAHSALLEIEDEFRGEEYCKFVKHVPEKPRLSLEELETYYETVPSICADKELLPSKGRQKVKIELLFIADKKFAINKIKQPKLFALETENEFNVLALESLFADKLTTLGPNTIGVSDERADEQFKQIYDVITLFRSNMNRIIQNIEDVRAKYREFACLECQIHGIPYDSNSLFEDMKLLIDRVKNIENDNDLLQRAYDFQSLYLRRTVNRNKTEWAIVGYQLDLLANYVFGNGTKVLWLSEIENLVDILKFDNVHGPERGTLVGQVRNALEQSFGAIELCTIGLFKKRIDRIIWELVTIVDFDTVKNSVRVIIEANAVQSSLTHNP